MPDNYPPYKFSGNIFRKSFEGKKALILEGAFHSSVVSMFAEAGFERAPVISEADIVVFTGGTDVDPTIYGEKPLPQTQRPDFTRDLREMEAYESAQDLGKICVGICRGAQFLHVMNDGVLWQHVTNHAGRDHVVIDVEKKVTLSCNSLHHQMLISNQFLDIIAYTKAPVSTEFRRESETLSREEFYDEGFNEIEAGAYKGTRCFFVQGHPEIGEPIFQDWFFSHLEDRMKQWGYLN